MPANRQTPWLVCYDIADPNRLRQVHNEVCQYATPFQYSVFRTRATRREIVGRLDTLKRIIDSHCDDIRAYPLLTAAASVVYGRSLLASGLHFAWTPELFDNQVEPTRLANCDSTQVCNLPRNPLKILS